MKQITINGFGRIGRTFLRTIILDKIAQSQLNVAAINIGPNKSFENIALFFKYDSLMGTLPQNIRCENDYLLIDKLKIKLFSEADPEKLKWGDPDWVVDASGHFTKREEAMRHINTGAKKVLITAPAENEDITIIPGVNDNQYDSKKHNIVSLGSCTTNCFAPIVKVLKDNFTLVSGLMTTAHAYTNDQVLLDIDHKDPRRARAAAINIIPTKTGADKVIIKIYPELKEKIRAVAIRVPVPKVSLLDFTFLTKETLSKELINEKFKMASSNIPLKKIIEYSELPLVSSDFSGNCASCIFDSLLTVSTENMSKVFGWYDNEWGYSMRLKEFLLHNS